MLSHYHTIVLAQYRAHTRTSDSVPRWNQNALGGVSLAQASFEPTHSRFHAEKMQQPRRPVQPQGTGGSLARLTPSHCQNISEKKRSEIEAPLG